MFLGFLGLRAELDELFSSFCEEGDGSVDFGEEGVVFAHADAGAWVEFGAALSDKDAPGPDAGSAEGFDAEAPALRVASVF